MQDADTLGAETRAVNALGGACLRGVGEIPWVLEFVKVARLADRPLEHLDQVPLLPAPTEEGQWTDKSTSTLEAKKWLLSILCRTLGQDPDAPSLQ